MTSALIAILVFIAGLAFWQAAMAARAVANAAAQGACARADAQLLDGTVVFRQMRLARVRGGRMSFRRTYVFDYSDDGVGRRQGFVILLGHQVEVVGLGPTVVSSAPAAPLH